VRTSEQQVSAAASTASTARPVRWVPTLDQVWVFVALTLPTIAGLMGMATTDLAYHIRVGNLILAHGIPHVDSFTFTAAGRPWLDQQWGTQVVLATAYRMGAWQALALLRATLMLATFAPVFLACRARGASKRSASILTMTAFIVSLGNLGMRPQMLALPLFTTTVWLVLDRRRHPRRLWIVPLMAVAWSNLHGSFVLAPALLGLASIEDLARDRPSLRTTAGAACVTLVATLVNPFGLGAWGYALEIASSPTIRTAVQEWGPTTFGSLTGVIFFLSVGAVAVVLARRKDAVPRFDLMWLGVFFGLALPAVRGVIWWALVAPPIVAGLIAEEYRPARERGDRAALNITVMASMLALFGLLLPWRSSVDPWTGTPPQLIAAPQHLVEATAHAIPSRGRVFVSQPWGSWFEFAVPTDPVFVDSRIEIFPNRVWNDYVDVMTGREGWQGILDRWHVDAVVLQAEDTTLGSLIAKDPGWRLVYRDELGSVFVRA
jgi:hypothetical protein